MSPVSQPNQGTVKRYAIVGAIAGLVLGFLTRPAVPFIGQQLPLGTVLTRGANLNGLDMLLRPIAEESFNRLIAGALFGAAILAGVRYMMLQNAARPAVPASPPPPPPTMAAALTGGSGFCTSCGGRLVDESTFCGQCGARRA